jgi:class 3 adenylate cyclase/tetratricopeptide (TPR) repeat protein
MSEIRKWLESISLGQYVDAFEANEIGMDLLGQVDDQMLKDIGVSIGGHRLRIRNAIAKLTPVPVAEVNLSPTTPKHETTAASAERRQLTVMFCDLVGSTALSIQLDPEDLRGIISAYHRCCTELVERNGGFVAKYMGDGVLAYFGYPQAHEHDAERAVRAGLSLVEAVPKLATHGGSPLQVRVGIATGLVVVGDLIGAGAAQEQAVVGETPNLAARLQALAEPGSVVIASSTRRLTGGLFEYRDLGSVALKGFGENVPVWQVLGASTAESRFEALRATTTPLIGRDEEIDLLLRRWEQAKRGDGQVALISGEPGIGKSRIAQTILERNSAEPHTRLRYFCSPHHQDSALYPSITQLERAAGFRREDTDEQRLAKLEAVLAKGTDDLSQVVPLLADLLSIPMGNRYQLLSLTPQKRKEKTLHAQLAQVEGLAAKQPVLMVFEDIHWSDPTTRESLDLVVDRVPTLRVLVIVTFRPEFAPPWIGRPHVTMLNLNRLPPRQRADMIVHLTGGRVLPKEIAEQIVDRTDGVPLFIEELTKTVVESGLLADVGGRFAMTGPVAPLAIPTTLQASLLARLDRLAPTRELAQIGAALGRQFSHELISAVAPMPQPQVDDALAQLVRAELLFQRGTPPNAEYTFKHALVQDAAYSTLLRSRRQQLHARIASTLEDRFPETAQMQPELLARHCAEAGFVQKAVGYWLDAGRHATARSAMNEAVAQFRNGLQLLSGIPEEATRQIYELDLQSALGHALIATKGYSAPEAGDAYARARLLCDQLDSPSQLGPILYGQYAFRTLRGELAQAEHHAEEMRNLGEVSNDGIWKCFGGFVSGNVSSWLGKFLDSRAYLENALSSWNPTFRNVPGAAADLNVSIRIFLSRTLACLGYVDQALLQRDEAVADARPLAPFNLAYALGVGWYGVNWAVQGVKSAPTMLRCADELLAIANEQGFPVWIGIGSVMRGWCLSGVGQATEGPPLMLQGIATYRATGCNVLIPFFLTVLAEAYAMAEQPEEGLSRLAEAEKLLESTTRERWAEAEMHRMRATLLLSRREHAEAEDSFQQAIAVARRQSARFWELRAALDLARLWRDQRKRTEARDLLAPIYGWFTEGFDTPILQEAKALLDELA